MNKRLLLLFALGMLTGCSDDAAIVPQTPEEVSTFADALAFLSGSTDVDVTDVQVQVESHAMPTEPISVSHENAEALLSLIETVPITFEQYEPMTVYGAASYAMICTLENGETITLYPDGNALEFGRREQDADGIWQSVYYRLVPEDLAAAEEIYLTVRQLWTDAYRIPEGETRTVAQILGEDILEARQMILRMSLDGKSGTEIRLYVDTAAHPDLFDALTGLTLEQSDAEAGEPYMEILFHIGEEDYRFGKHILTHCLTVRGERLTIDIGTDVSYRMILADGSFFTDWLTEWVYTHRDDEGVNIVRWDAE